MSTVLATQVRKHTTARPTRAAGRYWKGKAPKGVAEAHSDSDEDQEQEDVQEEGDVPIGGEEDFAKEEEEEESLATRSTQARPARALNVSLKDVSISRDGKVIVAGREESGRTLMEEGVSRNNNFPAFCSHQSSRVEESEEEEEAQDRAEEEEEASTCAYGRTMLLTMLHSRVKKSPSLKKKKSPNRSSDLYLSPSMLLLPQCPFRWLMLCILQTRTRDYSRKRCHRSGSRGDGTAKGARR